MIDAIQKATLEGYIAGLTQFAWWKDGTQYVGTCGTTLSEAVAEAKKVYQVDQQTRKE